jgi:hypothetical protein
MPRTQKTEPKRNGYGTEAGPKRDRSGTEAGPKRNGYGTEAGPKRDRSGTDTEPKRDRSGTEAGRVRNRSGTEAGRIRNRSGTEALPETRHNYNLPPFQNPVFARFTTVLAISFKRFLSPSWARQCPSALVRQAQNPKEPDTHFSPG